MSLLHMIAISFIAVAAACGVAATGVILLAWLTTWPTRTLAALSALVLLVVSGVWLGAGG